MWEHDFQLRMHQKPFLDPAGMLTSLLRPPSWICEGTPWTGNGHKDKWDKGEGRERRSGKGKGRKGQGAISALLSYFQSWLNIRSVRVNFHCVHHTTLMYLHRTLIHLVSILSGLRCSDGNSVDWWFLIRSGKFHSSGKFKDDTMIGRNSYGVTPWTVKLTIWYGPMTAELYFSPILLCRKGSVHGLCSLGHTV